MRRVIRALPAVMAAAAVVAAGAGAARAATVRVDVDEPDYSSCRADCPPAVVTIVFAAAAGERNDVTVTRDSTGARVLHDSGAVVTTRDCTPIDDHTVSCGRYENLRVAVRDGDDAVTVVDGPGTAEGGSGNDHLTGGPQAETLVGGSGNDELHGGAGDDRLKDGAARLRGEGTNDDLLDGGEGADWVDYAGRLAPVAVDLGQPGSPAGQAGEHDVLSGIENAAGGADGDILTGDDGKNELNGGAASGADVLRGAGGDDTIYRGLGDRTFGGAGRDGIRFDYALPDRGAGLDRVHCGPDPDLIDAAGPASVVDDSCEVVRRNADSIRHHLPLASPSDPVLTLDQYGAFPWSQHIELRASGIAAHRRHPPAGTLLATTDTGLADPVDLRLSNRGVALLRRYGRIRTRVMFGRATYERLGYMIDLRMPPAASPRS
jgi:hemolysin type calcium-binding protein